MNLRDKEAIIYGVIWKWIESPPKRKLSKRKKKKLKAKKRYKAKQKKDNLFYKSKGWIDLRNEALNRDDYTCQECGSKNNLQVHHVKYRYKSNKLKDLETLCLDCHANKHPVNGPKMLKSKRVISK